MLLSKQFNILLTAITLLIITPKVYATSLISGSYTGTIGGEALNFSFTGTLDEGQGSINGIFQNLPNQISSPAMLGLIITFYCLIRPQGMDWRIYIYRRCFILSLQHNFTMEST